MKSFFNFFSVFSIGLILSSVIFIFYGLTLNLSGKIFFLEWSFLNLTGSDMIFGVWLDWMSLTFMSVVCLISGSILKYCTYYMEGEKNFIRFCFILLLFVASMMMLILSPNLISILLGWDGLGLTSYLLVIFYQSSSSYNAGMITVLSNRVGDVAILLSIAIFSTKGGWTFCLQESSDKLSLFLICLAAMTKSAQMPFSAWLPMAMAAPTPVSALVHSSTLVTAGVYLLIRNSHLMESSEMSYFIMWTGAITMFMSGLGANFEGDMKKVVALSTLSQLGVMMLILGYGEKNLAFFHLITHALFKSTLFMCAGFMIHSAKNSQDFRQMSGFSVSSPLLGLVLGVTNMSLCGFPFLAGFFSKDVILESVFSGSMSGVLMMVSILGTGFTVSYSFRFLFLGFMKSSLLSSVSGVGELNLNLIKCMFFLVVMSVSSGFLVFWFVFLFSEGLSLFSAQKYWVLSIIVFMVFVMFVFLNMNSSQMSQLNFEKLSFLSNMWFLSKLSSKPGSLVSLKSGMKSSSLFDNGWLEFYGATNSGLNLYGLSSALQNSQKGLMVCSYLLWSVLFFLFMFA